MERWLAIVGYEGLYEISDQGRVRSIKRRGSPGRVLSPYVHKGYRYAKLWRGNRETRLLIHRLMLTAFVGPSPKEKPFGLHDDDNPANNVLGNLRWGVGVARRAWLEAGDVLNTKTVDEFRAALRRSR
jgi:hypothetical protein